MKRNAKKLSLNRESVRLLTGTHLNGIAGGIAAGWITMACSGLDCTSDYCKTSTCSNVTICPTKTLR